MTMSFKGAARRLDDIDLPRIGSRIGVGEDEIHAFMDVEAAGSPFDNQGRPKMLFEPHIFHELLGRGAKRDAAVKAGLAYPKWGTKPYPKESYSRLAKAMEIDPAKALMACSWGLTQILGRWHKDIGYATPQAMVEAFMEDAEHHLEATVQLLVTWKIDDDLRAHRWAVVAETWNGPGYAKNKYDTKLAKAFAKWQKIRDTPYVPEKAEPTTAPAKAEPVSKDTIVHVQARLRELGYTEVGPADGKIGKLTRTAILAFRNENDLPVSTEIDDVFLTALAKASARNLPRNEAATAEVLEKVPEAKASWWNKTAAQIIGLPTAAIGLVGGALDNIPSATGIIEPVKSLLSDVPWEVWIAAVAVICLVIYLNAHRAQQKSVEAYREGARR